MTINEERTVTQKISTKLGFSIFKRKYKVGILGHKYVYCHRSLIHYKKNWKGSSALSLRHNYFYSTKCTGQAFTSDKNECSFTHLLSRFLFTLEIRRGHLSFQRFARFSGFLYSCVKRSQTPTRSIIYRHLLTIKRYYSSQNVFISPCFFEVSSSSPTSSSVTSDPVVYSSSSDSRDCGRWETTN